MAFRIRHFATIEQLNSNLYDRLASEFTAASHRPRGIMLSGGGTPLSVYRMLADAPRAASRKTTILYSDDRMVPLESSDSNFGNTQKMLSACGVSDDRIIHVQSTLPLDRARDAYDAELGKFLDGGAAISLGILGLGADGHTASLFTVEDARQDDRYALSVVGFGGFDRISVTRKVLMRIESLLFLVVGAAKAEILQKLLDTPDDLPAGVAVHDHPNVEIWTDLTVSSAEQSAPCK